MKNIQALVPANELDDTMSIEIGEQMYDVKRVSRDDKRNAIVILVWNRKNEHIGIEMLVDPPALFKVNYL